MIHRKLKFTELNATPLGTVIAAPTAELRELFCRDGLKHFQRIRSGNVLATLIGLKKQFETLQKIRPETRAGAILQLELVLAARMAAASCGFVLWQQAVLAGDRARARALATTGIRDLEQIDRLFENYWPLRNKGTTAKCSPFLQWRISDYRRK